MNIKSNLKTIYSNLSHTFSHIVFYGGLVLFALHCGSIIDVKHLYQDSSKMLKDGEVLVADADQVYSDVETIKED